MRRVDRSLVPAPLCLDAKDKQGRTEYQRAKDHQAERTPGSKAFDYAVYRNDEVKRALAALFHGKCAYCETFYAASSPVDVEHYRPKGAVKEAPDHPGYWWLAMRWENLLPSCIDCNRRRGQQTITAGMTVDELLQLHSAPAMLDPSGKQDRFPVRTGSSHVTSELEPMSGEQPLLLDPSVDDPRAHLQFHVGQGMPLGLVSAVSTDGARSERGQASIDIYGLNRLGLVQERTRVLRQLEFMGALVLELGCIIEDLQQDAVAAALHGSAVVEVPRRLKLVQDTLFGRMREMVEPTAPYSEMAKAWMDDFIRRLEA